jgi:hypothetical protein
MTDRGYRFCPRCGTALVAGLPFCPRCGFDSAAVGDRPESPVSPDDVADDALGWNPVPESPDAADARSSGSTAWVAGRQSADRASRGPAIVFGALIIAAGLVVFGLLQPAGGNPVAPQGGSSGPGGQVEPSGSPGPPAPIVGLTIESPPDGQTVATEEVTVIGIAPPGLKVTRDISFGLDQHATADGTGHWAINVRLNEGQNDLVFRIGDDRSTERKLRVTYTPPTAS